MLQCWSVFLDNLQSSVYTWVGKCSKYPEQYLVVSISSLTSRQHEQAISFTCNRITRLVQVCVYAACTLAENRPKLADFLIGRSFLSLGFRPICKSAENLYQKLVNLLKLHVHWPEISQNWSISWSAHRKMGRNQVCSWSKIRWKSVETTNQSSAQILASGIYLFFVYLSMG